MDRYLPSIAYHQTTLAAAGVGVVFKNLTIQERLLDLSESQSVGSPPDLRVLAVKVPPATHFALDIFDVHSQLHGYTRITRILTLDQRHFRMIRPKRCTAFELVPAPDFR